MLALRQPSICASRFFKPSTANVKHRRFISALPSNPDIYVHKQNNGTYILSFLSETPPIKSLAIGTTTAVPPSPNTFTENPRFLTILHNVLQKHAASDPLVQSEALSFSSPGGASIFAAQKKQSATLRRGWSGAGTGNFQGGAGGGGMGGWLHVYDQRGVPPFGRIADPQDIFGSVLVDGEGKVIPGHWEENGMYRLVTGETGIINLSQFLRERLVEALQKEAETEKSRA